MKSAIWLALREAIERAGLACEALASDPHPGMAAFADVFEQPDGQKGSSLIEPVI